MQPAGTLATGTVTMPAAPADGMTITVESTQQITALTVQGNAGQSLVNGTQTLRPNQPYSWVYRLSNTTWYPFAGATNSQIVSDVAQNSTSGTSIDFTGIPSWVKRITVMMKGVSTNGTSFYAVRVRVGGSPVSTNYSGAVGSIYETENIAINGSTSEIPIQALAPVAGSSMTGVLTLSKMNETGPVWAYSGTMYIPGGAATLMSYIAGVVTLSGAVDGIQITTTGGANTFDAGTINILYE
jgi:hypothetical protein